MTSKVKAKKAPAKRAAPKKIAPKAVKAPAQRRGRSSTSRISSKHQVTIPVEVLRNSNLVIGDEVEIAVNDNGVVELKKVAPITAFQAIADQIGGAFNDFDWEKERAQAWD
jgi:bifunctional DNA-binding transcriptional regulator/antitoxin component of YhaV-PrlF toxin-antitoxin module